MPSQLWLSPSRNHHNFVFEVDPHYQSDKVISIPVLGGLHHDEPRGVNVGKRVQNDRVDQRWFPCEESLPGAFRRERSVGMTAASEVGRTLSGGSGAPPLENGAKNSPLGSVPVSGFPPT